jgi:hypothetical protein
MVGIHRAGSAANVRRTRRETILTGFPGDARDTPPDFFGQFERIAPARTFVLDFERNERPTPEQSESVRRLQASLAKDRRGGAPDLVIVRPIADHTTTRSDQAALDFIQGWQRLTGKQVVFVSSASGQPLSFTGVVSPSDPNTIFLDAAGDRNVVALIGHEWAHTLQVTNAPVASDDERGRRCGR